jgi:hypothetical protein
MAPVPGRACNWGRTLDFVDPGAVDAPGNRRYLVAVVQSPRRLALSIGAAFALALVVGAAAAGVSGGLDVVLYAAPFLVIAALLLSGRFIGEERILAAYRTIPRARREGASWPRLPSLPLSSALERAPRSLRGPPAVLSV